MILKAETLNVSNMKNGRPFPLVNVNRVINALCTLVYIHTFSTFCTHLFFRLFFIDYNQP